MADDLILIIDAPFTRVRNVSTQARKGDPVRFEPNFHVIGHSWVICESPEAKRDFHCCPSSKWYSARIPLKSVTFKKMKLRSTNQAIRM